MSNQDNYEKKIIQVAEVLGLGSPSPSGDSLQMCCPFHEENHPSYGINKYTGAYNCFACPSKGHFNRLAQDLRGHIFAEHIEDIDNFRVSLKIYTHRAFEYKPSKNDFAKVKSSLRLENIGRVKVEDLITYILRGYTISPSGANTNNEWQQQQCFMLDFDNKYSNFTMEEVLDYASTINRTPTFTYYTFSHTEDKPKFRFVYCMKEPITVQKQMQAIVDNTLRLFKDFEPDTACRDLSHIFLGTNKIEYDVFTSNFIYSGTRFSMEQIDEVEKIIGVDVTGADSSGGAEYLVKGKVLHDELAKVLIQEYHIIKLNNLPYLYDKEEGIYFEGLNSGLLEDILVQNYGKLNIQQRQEVIESIKHSLGKNMEHCNYHYIGFQNGVLYLDLMELMPFSPDIIITSKLTVNYVNHLFDSNEVVDNFFNEISLYNPEMVVLFYRIGGICCCATNKFHKTFVFYGNGGNGKGKFFDIVKALVGKDLYSCVSLRQLTNDRFAPAELLGKTVNICADDKITSSKIDTEIVKSCLSEDPVNAQVKYGQPFVFSPVATFLIGTNYMLDLEDTSNAIDRRFVVIPMKAEFHEEDDNFDVNMTEKLTTPENLEYIAYKAMLYFSQVMRLGKFPLPDIVKKETARQLLDFNTVKQFVLDNPFRREKPATLLENYGKYCEENGLEAVSPKKFFIDLKNVKVKGIDSVKDVKYVKRKLVDPADGNQKNYYVTTDYKSDETHNPMISRYGNNVFNDLITAIETGSIEQEDLQTLIERINNATSINIDFSGIEIEDPKG